MAFGILWQPHHVREVVCALKRKKYEQVFNKFQNHIYLLTSEAAYDDVYDQLA